MMARARRFWEVAYGALAPSLERTEVEAMNHVDGTTSKVVNSTREL